MGRKKAPLFSVYQLLPVFSSPSCYCFVRAAVISVLPDCVCFPPINIVSAFLISLRHLYYVSFQKLFLFSFCSYCLVFRLLCCCVLVPSALAFHLFDPRICVIFVFDLPLSQSVTTYIYNYHLSRIRNQNGHWVH